MGIREIARADAVFDADKFPRLRMMRQEWACKPGLLRLPSRKISALPFSKLVETRMIGRVFFSDHMCK